MRAEASVIWTEKQKAKDDIFYKRNDGVFYHQVQLNFNPPPVQVNRWILFYNFHKAFYNRLLILKMFW